jgi:hyaluronan synthase
MKNLAIEQQKAALNVDTKKAFSDMGFKFLFLLTVYAIMLVKITTGHSIQDQLFFGAYSIAITTYIFSRFIFSYFHRRIPFDVKYEPSVTFVVPAKNEADNIAETMLRFGEVDYPMNKVEVIAINDGSTDGTLAEMHYAAKVLKQKIGRVEVVDWKVNKGKRHGMAEGVFRAKNDIIIFIDSDSFIDRNCVRHLVKYFSLPEVGAVSGHTDVYNRDENMLTRMQAIRYYIAFKVYKAAESVFGMVTCCPGCCSAYRRKYMMDFMDDWLHQRFLGKECTFGDDRSLTNFMIQKYRAVYSPEAKAYTVVPDTFKTYMRQQQRWKKSWIRETFIACSFVWKRNPLAAIFFYMYVFLAFSSPIVFIRAMIWHPYVYHVWPVAYLGGLFLMLLLHGLYYRIQLGKRSWFIAIISFWFHTVVLMWQLPWALFTIADTRWGTR